MKQISPLLDRSEHAAEAIDEATKHTWLAADKLYSTCEEVRDEINKATDNSSNEISSILEHAKGDMNKALEGLHKSTKQTKVQGVQEMYEKGTKTPYADALSRQLPSTHAGTLARICARNRQILIDKSPDAPANPLSNLDEGKLVEKGNEALSKMATQNKHPPTEIRIVRAKKLQNGGIVYELINPESATWL